MAMLVWDAPGEKKFEVGCDRGVLYPQDNTGAYPKGVAWSGLSNVTDSPEGAEATDIWADNQKYGSIRSAEVAKGTIEAYYYPKEFQACMGKASLVEGVTIGQQKRTSFGFSYRTLIQNDTATEEDDGYKIHLVWGATASPSEESHDTINDSPDVSPFSWEYDTTPVNVKGFKPTATMEIDSTEVSPEALAAIEKVLYGADDGDGPRLPLPDEIKSIMEAAVSSMASTVSEPGEES